jgi:integrase
MALRNQLGHKSVSTTSIYAQHAAVLDLAAAMKQRPD